MTRRNRAFIWHPYGPPQPVERLKFAVVNADNRIVSAVWTVFPARDAAKPDIYVAASGVGSSAKFSFHGDVLSHSILSQAFEGLLAKGVVNTQSRHQQRLPIPSLPWHGLTLRLVPDFLRKKGHSPDEYNGTIVALPVPPTRTVLEIGFILAQGTELNVHGAQGTVGQVASGGRALLVVWAFRELDAEAHKADMDAALSRIPVPSSLSAELDPDVDLAAMLYGEEQGFMTVTEVHNIRYRPS